MLCPLNVLSYQKLTTTWQRYYYSSMLMNEETEPIRSEALCSVTSLWALRPGLPPGKSESLTLEGSFPTEHRLRTYPGHIRLCPPGRQTHPFSTHPKIKIPPSRSLWNNVSSLPVTSICNAIPHRYKAGLLTRRNMFQQRWRVRITFRNFLASQNDLTWAKTESWSSHLQKIFIHIWSLHNSIK